MKVRELIDQLRKVSNPDAEVFMAHYDWASKQELVYVDRSRSDTVVVLCEHNKDGSRG